MTGVIDHLGRGSGALLIVAAIAKSLSHANFTQWIDDFVGLSGHFAMVTVATVIAAEAAVGLASLWRPRLAAPFSLVRFIAFAVFHVRLLSDPALVACPCFGTFLPSSATTQWGLLAACVMVVMVQVGLVLGPVPQTHKELDYVDA